MKPKIAAFVPMRHHSARVPQKNFRLFAGKPLYHHILSTLIDVPEISMILVDTDSPVILEGLAAHFPDVKAVLRPEHLRGDMVPMNDILLHDTSLIEAEYYLQTHSTNPLLKADTISKAIHTFLDNLPEFDSLFGVTRLQTRLWDSEGKPINHDPDVLLRTQDLPAIYEENSCIYIFRRETLVERQNRLGYHPLMFEIPAVEAWDIDEKLDFVVAETLYHQLQTKK
ncbi:MAG TPA: acylneuraminate cytidylyltransferase [Anaerolineaceae bacterium]|nr:MAG: Acylneuraminate cytidylyltransferase [Anaerolineaceae bacterium 46_22]HAF47879.1 acylneuraminate cytidylyltransferase [Anaerolineaceae bacterium]